MKLRSDFFVAVAERSTPHGSDARAFLHQVLVERAGVAEQWGEMAVRSRAWIEDLGASPRNRWHLAFALYQGGDRPSSWRVVHDAPALEPKTASKARLWTVLAAHEAPSPNVADRIVVLVDAFPDDKALAEDAVGVFFGRGDGVWGDVNPQAVTRFLWSELAELAAMADPVRVAGWVHAAAYDVFEAVSVDQAANILAVIAAKGVAAARFDGEAVAACAARVREVAFAAGLPNPVPTLMAMLLRHLTDVVGSETAARLVSSPHLAEPDRTVVRDLVWASAQIRVHRTSEQRSTGRCPRLMRRADAGV